LENINFKFLATLHLTFESKNYLNLVLDFYPGGEFFFQMQKRRFTEKQIKLYFCEILLALEYLHNKKIVYRDLKVYFYFFFLKKLNLK